MKDRFRGYLPVVIDVETAGFNAQTDALLEIAAVFLAFDDDGQLVIDGHWDQNVLPFKGANLEQSALDFTGIDPYCEKRHAILEADALGSLLKAVRLRVKDADCKRAILVGHNAHFDQGFLRAALARTDIKRDPFHPFSCLDTVSLSALAYGQTVLSVACKQAEIEFDNKSAHSALYDATKTAELFIRIVNQMPFTAAVTS
jgi:ribonuclease T